MFCSIKSGEGQILVQAVQVIMGWISDIQAFIAGTQDGANMISLGI